MVDVVVVVLVVVGLAAVAVAGPVAVAEPRHADEEMRVFEARIAREKMCVKGHAMVLMMGQPLWALIVAGRMVVPGFLLVPVPVPVPVLAIALLVPGPSVLESEQSGQQQHRERAHSIASTLLRNQARVAEEQGWDGRLANRASCSGQPDSTYKQDLNGDGASTRCIQDWPVFLVLAEADPAAWAPLLALCRPNCCSVVSAVVVLTDHTGSVVPRLYPHPAF